MYAVLSLPPPTTMVCHDLNDLQAHNATKEISIPLSSISLVEPSTMRQGREKLGFAIHHTGRGTPLLVEAVSERARKQWVEGLMQAAGKGYTN